MKFFRDFRRRRILERSPVSDDAWEWVLTNHPIISGLEREGYARLRELTGLFLAEKVFEGAEGLSVTAEMRLSVAVQACLPILELGIEWYDNWKTVVLVPAEFTSEQETRDHAGVVHEWEEEDAGESWDDGPVVLSWADVEASGWGDGFNVVIHEAAHRLDMTDGGVNGRPALHRGMDPAEWHAVCSAAFSELSRRAARRGRKSPKIDSYAAENDAEFFAVMSEYFFENGGLVKSEYPDVYGLFTSFYRQDPAGRAAGGNRRKPAP